MSAARLWAVMPAAGSGQRFGGATPKQYLTLVDRPVIQHGIDTLLALPGLLRLVVAIAADDQCFAELDAAGHPRVDVVTGGRERADSVLAGLDALADDAAADDWVLVHDAARPLLRLIDVERLVQTLHDDPVGGLLAVPVADTLKRCDASGAVTQTVAREGLWAAQTPQMFRYQLLRDCLRKAVREKIVVTDEAMAVELAGLAPRVVEGTSDNFKITLPSQLNLATMLLTEMRS